MAPSPKRSVKWAVSAEYKASWIKHSSGNTKVRDALTEFNKAKREIPPKRLPDRMRDHTLSGPLNGIRECHLEGDVLLLYTHKNDLVKLLLVCQHADLQGSRGKTLKKRIARLK